MANPGGAASKFVSVNLNKSYGPSSHHQSSSSSYGQAAAGRVRTGTHGGGAGGGGGGGMVVLSRPKSSQKTAPKLSVPPPLNLPSMRKEHERFDSSGSGNGSSGTGGSGTVPRPTSSGMGWTKTGASVGLQDKDGKLSGEAHGYDQGVQVVPDVTRGTSSYSQFSARSNATGIQGSISASFTSKGPGLRGEDFPSLQAALPTPSSGPIHKAKDGSQKTHKHLTVEDSFPEQTDVSLVKPLVDMRPHGRSSNYSHVNGSNDNNSIYGLGSSHSKEQLRKHEEHLPGSFPLIRLNPRSDWADDERDTGNKFSERTQNHGFSKSDVQRNGEFDIPKHSVFPAKSAQYERWSHRDDMRAKIPHSDAPKAYPYRRDVGTPNGEGNMQRTAPIVKHIPYPEEIASDRNGAGERSVGHKYAPPHFGDNLRDDRLMINRESFPGRKDVRFAQEGKHQWNQDRYRNEQSNRNHANVVQNNPVLKSSYSTNKWAHDSVLNYSRENPPVSKVDRSYLEDDGGANFDEIDPLTGTILSVIKRKKDARQTDFHDPGRESFEAELERVQQMQEKERQRIYEEQERAIEQARREEEERQRMIREEEECHKRLEEEARLSARREEQERLEAIRIAEEQRIARDEEKQRILMEEEQSKERAKQKLLELEAKIARRQSEASKTDLTTSLADEKDKDMYRSQEADNWEDSERMVERITTSAHSESSSDNRPYESGLRSQPPFRDGYSVFPDRAKPPNLWRRDILDEGNNSSFIQNEEDNAHHRQMQNASSMARAFPRKELHGRNSQGEVINHGKDQRWSSTVSEDLYNRNRESNNDFDGNFAERYGGGWGAGHFRGNPSHSSFTEHPSPETDELYSYTRSRYPVRQPRVLLPPPSLESIRKTSIREENERPSSSSFGDDDMHYNHHASRSEPSMRRGYYNAEQENAEASADVETRNNVQEQRPEECSTRCDSQSSLSLSSPPDSPVHLSHDDLDEYRDSPVISAIAEGKEVPLSANEMFGKENPGDLLHSISAASVHDDWTPEDERDLLGQEEYDEDEDGYNEEETHEGNDEQLDLTHEFEDLHLELEDGGDSLVLGFNDGVEVSIPNDDEFDKNSKNKGSVFGVSVVQVQEQDRVDRQEDVEDNLEPVSRFSVMETDDSSRTIEETETLKQDSVSEAYGLSSSSHMMTAAAVPSSSSQTELPSTQLHFGLFTGPSLIPSSFPAIQIGSIHLPLHLHSTVGPTLSHVHSTQPPFFQFGQFRYASPISQGILPISPQSVSIVQSSSGQCSGGLLSIQPDQEKFPYNITNNAQLQKCQTVFPISNKNKVNEFTSLVDGERNHVSALLKESVTEKESGGSKALGRLSGAKGNRSDYSNRNADSRSSYPTSESSRSFSAGFQRRPRRTTQRAEFKVWESVDKKQSSGQVSSNHYFRPKDDKSNFTGRTTHGYVKRESKNGSNRLPMKHTVESLGSGSSNSHGADPARRHDKKMVEQRLTKSGDENLKINAILPEEDEDAPLQSGVVRIFKQSGIEAPSDEDDFIEVRSKRQMLNVRREQREKEIKAKSRVPKAPRRLRSTPQTDVSARSNRSISVRSQISKITSSDFGISERKILANVEASTGVQSIVSPPLAPIGTPAVSSIVMQADKRPHNVKTVSTDGEGLGSGVIFQSNSKILDSIQTSLSSWNNNSRINEQVLSLTQTQLDDAMKPHKYETSVNSMIDHGSIDSDVATKDKIFSSATNPINSLLAGEKIQFGAVTSPSILLPTNRVVKHGNGAPGPSRPDINISQNVAAAKNDTAVLFNKDKHPNKPCTNLDVSEAEVAASAVAAISNNGNGLLGTCSITGLTVDQPLDGQSRAEDSLSVSLPADLSVENPPISFWPGLPSPHSSSSQFLPHFSGGGPSHFPFFDMNHPMLRSPIYAFNRQDEQSASQQLQNNGNSTPMGAWQQCHSGIESFYGCPPTGFTGPFLSNPGGGGVQGLPPHMVVYNHFAPVGHYGGLSFMGTTYIPSGKQQPDWKHNHPAAGIINEGGDVNMVNAQGIPPPSLATTTAQHLASSSPLLSMMPSPLPTFDAPPYQPAPDMSVQGHWPHILTTPSLAILQQNNESTRLPPPQLSQVPPPNHDQLSNRNFSMAEKTGSSQLLDSSNNSMVKPDHLSSGSTTKPDSGNENNTNHMKTNNGFKWQQQQQKNVYNNNQHHHNQSQRKNMGSEWSSSNQNPHRMGFHGRNQSVGGDKTYPSSSMKMKQIYVPKQNPSTQNPTSG